MSAGNFRFRAVVDWVAVEIHLTERSNFWTVQAALRAALRLPNTATPYIEPLDEGDGRAASMFRLRIQDPKRMSRVTQALAELHERFQLKAVEIVAIEVAFDTYRKGGTLGQLAEIAADRFRFLTSAPGDDWYFYRDKGDGRRYVNTLDHRRELIRCFEEQWQLTDRQAKSADVRYHAYVKTRDADRQLLPQHHRARIEITLQGASLPFRTAEALEAFNFTALAKHFKFRRFADNLHPAARLALMSWSKEQHGRRGKYRRPNRSQVGRYAGTSVFKCSTVADEELNAVVYECLRKLTRDWRRTRSAADFPERYLEQTRTAEETPTPF
jgi:hypothetical protein